MRYFLELSYLGTRYRGWQRQRDAVTVQQTLEEALARLLGEAIVVTGAGRTDTGVHAARYTAHFDTATQIGEGVGESASGAERSEAGAPRVMPPTDFIYHANSMLPPDIAIRGIRRVADDAHARYDAIAREYTYYVLPFKDPFRTHLAWQYTVPLDLEAMNHAAAVLLETRDFTTFAKLGSDNKSNICHVSEAVWQLESAPSGGVGAAGFAGGPFAGGEISFTIRADRFLRNMVRAIVGTLVDVGRGKITPERFAEIVAARDLSLSSGGAPARGLFLTDIRY